MRSNWKPQFDLQGEAAKEALAKGRSQCLWILPQLDNFGGYSGPLLEDPIVNHSSPCPLPILEAPWCFPQGSI